MSFSVIVAALLSFLAGLSVVVAYRIGYGKGYTEGFMDSARHLVVKAFEEAGFEDKETIQ